MTSFSPIKSQHIENAILLERFKSGLILLTQTNLYYINENKNKEWSYSHNFFKQKKIYQLDIQLLINKDQNKFLILHNNSDKGLLYKDGTFVPVNIKIPFSILSDLRYLWYDELYLFNVSSPCAVLTNTQILPTSYIPLLKKYPSFKTSRRNKTLHHYNANFIRTSIKDQIVLYHDFTGENLSAHLGLFSLKDCSVVNYPIPEEVPTQPIRVHLFEKDRVDYKGIFTQSGIRLAYNRGLFAIIYNHVIYVYYNKEILETLKCGSDFHFIDGEFSNNNDGTKEMFYVIERNNTDLSNTILRSYNTNRPQIE